MRYRLVNRGWWREFRLGRRYWSCAALNAGCLQLLENVFRDLRNELWRDIALKGRSYSLIDGLRLNSHSFRHSGFRANGRMVSRLREVRVELTVPMIAVVVEIDRGLLLRSDVLMIRRVVSGHDLGAGWRDGRSLTSGCYPIAAGKRCSSSSMPEQACSGWA